MIPLPPAARRLSGAGAHAPARASNTGAAPGARGDAGRDARQAASLALAMITVSAAAAVAFHGGASADDDPCVPIKSPSTMPGLSAVPALMPRRSSAWRPGHDA